MGVRRDQTFPRTLLNYFLLILFAFVTSSTSGDQSSSVEPGRCIPIEIYFRGGDREQAEAVAAIEKLKAARGGITLVLRDTDRIPENQERLDKILRHYKVAPKTSPVIYGCDRIIHDVSPSDTWESQLRAMLRLEVFVRTGCPHCAAAKRWLPQFKKEYPGFELVYHDITVDSSSASRLSRLVEQHKTMAASVPVFYLLDRLIVGFESSASTGERLRTVLKQWTHVCPGDDRNSQRLQKEKSAEKQSTSMMPRQQGRMLPFVAVQLLGVVVTQNSRQDIEGDQTVTSDEDFSLPLPADDTAKIADDELPMPGEEVDIDSGAATDDQIDLPVFGRLSASRLGMPLFTLAIGLVDGFNPCAMWVLLFLLSILVNLGDRRRILAIAGTFVIVSGLAYFAFMAAWLNVFMLIGYLRPIQIALALIAIVIGLVHIKDFFAFKHGLSLSIPESAKPGIYARVRRIVTAEHMAGAVSGAIVLAILVNIIELLCTAGLPALYTNILMQQGFSSSARYAYLALYIAAYMVDDTLMVSIVVITLSKRKLQETQGRWLKLISGAAILLLGIIMLLRPEWLH